ncbi:MAG: hypothetical protein LH614_04775 [Pyrinomonadaceae bacterium]|nr:hypothetical protein [Pyrinomonadaceae bacterium]
MKTKADELDRMFLWLLLTGGLISLLVYGLFSLVAPPAAETITTHAPALNSTNAMQEVNFRPRKSK